MSAKDFPDFIALLTAVAAFFAVTGLALAVRHMAFRALRRWSTTARSLKDDVVIGSLRVPSFIWCLLLGLYVTIDLSHWPLRPTTITLNIVYALLVLSITAAAANLCAAALGYALRQHDLPIPATGLSFTMVTVSIWTLGGLVLLSSLGVSIAPILTALGVGGLAVALALQDTLTNFFAGVHLLLSKPIRVGDYVRLEGGQEGHVVDIGWRATKLRTLAHNLVVVPNSKMAQSILVNYSLPDPHVALTISVNVGYDADPDRVEQLLLEEVRAAVGPIPGLLGDPPPTARLLPGFGDSALTFTVACFVGSVEAQFPVQHELRKRILARFRRDGITMPYPQQTVHLKPHADTQGN
jgi:small-conductance mechanosensitive channel